MNDDFDWYQIKFLESTGNLTDIISGRSSATVSLEVATDIAVCLQQGRAFFEQSEQAALEIRPLLVYYGMLAFGRAIILSRRIATLNTLARAHGLADSSGTVTPLQDLEVTVRAQGTFPELIDSTRNLEKLLVYNDDTHSQTKLVHPPSESRAISGKPLTLKTVLSRIPGLGMLYIETFQDVRRVVTCSHFEVSSYYGETRLEVHGNGKLGDRNTLKSVVGSLRSRFEFLKQWSISLVYKDVGTICFSTRPRDEAIEFSEDHLRETDRDFVQTSLQSSPSYLLADPRSKVSPVYGNLRDGDTCIIEPIDGIHLSELSLYYAGMYLLSSLVRYRPPIWANSISRRSLGAAQPDDKPLALIERFLQLAIKRFPKMTVNAIREPD